MPGQSGLRSNDNEGVLRISQSSSITGTSPSDCLVSYPEHSLGGGSYPSAEVHSVYFTAPADWAIHRIIAGVDDVVIEMKWRLIRECRELAEKGL